MISLGSVFFLRECRLVWVDEYFHVVVELSGKSGRVFLFGDLSREELKRTFLRPYRLGKDFFIKAEVIKTQDIQKVAIIKSHVKKDDVLLAIQADSKAKLQQSSFVVMLPWGYSDEEVADAGSVGLGRDVTDDFLTIAPGQMDWVDRFKATIEDKVVPGLIGGLLLAILIGLWKLLL